VKTNLWIGNNYFGACDETLNAQEEKISDESKVSFVLHVTPEQAI